MAGYYPFTPLQARSAEIGRGSGCVTPSVPATAPVSVYGALRDAGLIPDPYFERNSLLCEWVKDRFWVWGTTFTPPREREGDRVFLHFSGIDYHAHVYLNDKKIGEHENMFTPFDLDVTEFVRFGEENRVQIILENAPDEMGQIGYTDRTHTQKARYTYKWDFCTRLVGMGLWREAYVEILSGARITQTRAAWDDKSSALTYRASLDRPAHVTFLLTHKGRVIADHEADVTDVYAHTVRIDSPSLWYPAGAGEQPLYEIDLLVTDERGEVGDHKHERVGLRTLSYRQCAGATPDSLPYIPVINGKPIFIRGVNLVPIDLMTGTETPEKRERLLHLVRDMGCNLVRVWGGGIIECDAFYDLCDELGIMIWQEMPQSSSGISNVPSKDPHFLALLADTAREAAISRRNHPCLTFFSGGNELMDEQGIPSTFRDENLAMIKKILGTHAPEILVLPTSASGPTEYGSSVPSENHDVHGPWKYGGVEGHYAHFNQSSIQLHSEFGCDGMTNLAMLKTFLAPENRARIETVDTNLTWRHHGEWWDTYAYRDFPLFGEMDGNLETFVAVSQYMQAEGLRYALEANRRRQWQCGGSIIWQLNEPWPNVSGTNLVDYSGQPKLAYYFCRDAFAPFHISLRYDKLTWEEGQTFRASVYLHDDDADIPVKRPGDAVPGLHITLFDEHLIPASEFDSGEIFFRIGRLGRAFRIALSYDDGTRRCENEYLFFVLTPEHPHASTSAVKAFVRKYRAKNGI